MGEVPGVDYADALWFFHHWGGGVVVSDEPNDFGEDAEAES